MAKHQVKDYSVEINPSGKWVDVKITTENKKPYKFALTRDNNYLTEDVVKQKLTQALDHCHKNLEKADISIFKERSYVTINVKDFIDTRFTGKSVN